MPFPSSFPFFCITTFLIQNSSQCWRICARQQKRPMVASPVLVLSMSAVKPWPPPKPRHLHVCAGGNKSTVTHGPPVRSGHVPRGQTLCQDQPRLRVGGGSCMRVQQAGRKVGMRKLCLSVLTRMKAHAVAAHVGSLVTCTFSPGRNGNRRVPAFHAPFHQVGMGRGEFLPSLPPRNISICV